MTAPVKSVKKKRIEGYDVARALAIFGMIIVNFKIVMGSSEAGSDSLVFLTGLLEGRAVALFVILAGIGLSLLSRSARLHDDPTRRHIARLRVFKRAIFLLFFGLLLASIWPGDILHFYGLYMLIATVVLFVSDRTLLILAGALVAGFVVLLLLLDYEAGWNWETLTITDFWTVSGMIRSMFFNGFHPVFPWAGFLIFGMWLGRQDVSNAGFRWRITGFSLVALILTELSSATLIATFTPEIGAELAAFLFSRSPLPPMPFYMLSAGSSAVIILMLMIHIGEIVSAWRIWRVLVTTGQFALTLYVAHIIIGMGIMEVFGWINGSQSLAFTVLYSVIFYLCGMLFAVLWQRQFARGPFEQLMRWLTDSNLPTVKTKTP